MEASSCCCTDSSGNIYQALAQTETYNIMFVSGCSYKLEENKEIRKRITKKLKEKGSGIHHKPETGHRIRITGIFFCPVCRLKRIIFTRVTSSSGDCQGTSAFFYCTAIFFCS